MEREEVYQIRQLVDGRWLEESNAYLAAKQYEEAIAVYDLVLELDPDNAQVYHNRGRAYHYLKEYQKAIIDYNHALELDPHLSLVKSERAAVYRILNRQ